MSTQLAKGQLAEEILRNYFLDIGYYTVRGIIYKYCNYEVTDVDLFLYSNSSPFTRDKINVDIKRKKTPQAMERIFWAKGLKSILGFNKCIVATTDSRPEVIEFGKLNNVTVLNGNFLNKLIERNSKKTKERIYEETFIDLLKQESIGELYGDWKRKYELNKSMLLKEPNFDLCNYYLKEINLVLTSIISSGKKEAFLRYLYTLVSFFLVTLDFAMKDILFKDESIRFKELDGYFRYGQRGLEKANELANASKIIMESFDSTLKEKELTISEVIKEQFSKINADILAQFFSTQSVASKLFDNAKAFERNGFLINYKQIDELEGELKSIIGVICDFNSIDRKKIM